MFELAGIGFSILSIYDLYFNTGDAAVHFIIGLILIITSMMIKTHSEVVQIKNYIGDSKKTDHVEVKED